MKTLIKTLGSLNFAVLLIAALVVLLTTSTITESVYGTPFAQRLFYQAGWFDIFLALVGVNILCSALSRWPYKLHHTGFLITHVGILLLLGGSLMTRLLGVEGQMTLVEGEKKNHILAQDYQLALHEPGNEVRVWDLKSLSPDRKNILRLSRQDRHLVLNKIEEGVTFTPQIIPGGASSEKNRAIQFTLESEMAKLHEAFWLIENSSEPDFSRHLSVGLADIELKEAKTDKPASNSAGPNIRITQKSTGKVYSVPLEPGTVKNTSFKEIGLTISDIIYYPDARVGEDNKLMNASDTPNNPAVRFALEDTKNHHEERVLFSLFPDFEAIHGRKSDNFNDLKVELDAPESQLAASSSKKSGLTFYMGSPQWTYESRSKNGVLAGTVKTGESQPTGWMDFTFHVDQVLENAVIEKKMTLTGSPKKGDLGTLLSLVENGKTSEPQWVIAGDSIVFETPEGPLTVALGLQSMNLPFRLKLLDFRKKDYPGTQNASSFESDVSLEDPADGVVIQKKIWMNHPLDYKGYRIFQSSYFQDPESGEGSIFTIAKNPGIIFIYGGAIVMFIGIVCVFYVKPLSYISARSPHVSKK